MKVAVVHDWIPMIAGAERVLEQILKVYPDADVFTLFDFLSEEEKAIFGDAKITSSYLNKWPKVEKYYRKLLPLCPQAIENFDLSGYDLVISSSHACAKGCITAANQVHVSYVHSPARYAWDLTHQYLKQANLDKGLKGYIAQNLLHKFRLWDARTANGVDHYISNSNYIARRIWKTYRREAQTIYPPVNIEHFSLCEEKEDFYLAASRQVPYKRIDLIVEAFTSMPDKRLIVIGDGPEEDKIKKIAQGYENIELKGFLDKEELRDYMQRAKAFVFAAEEDFGIIPVEAQACGTPVIAYGAGGALETVIDGKTGLFFEEQSAEAICNAIKRFESKDCVIKTTDCRAQAEKFAPKVFRTELKKAVDQAIKEHQSR
jgi:glycosyltransferase involved in cell wall biosynthesis